MVYVFSIDRVMQILTDIANGLCAQFEVENLRGGLFTVGALDNCDHNPSSTTSHDSFHDTTISLFQFPQ